MEESQSELIVMLTDLVEKLGDQEYKVQCTHYWPGEVGKTWYLEENRSITLKLEEFVMQIEDEGLWHSELNLTVNDETRMIHHYWLKGWRDGKGLKNFMLLNELLERMCENLKANPVKPPIIHCSGGVVRAETVIGGYLAKHLLIWEPPNIDVKEAAFRNYPVFAFTAFPSFAYFRTTSNIKSPCSVDLK